MFLDVLILTTVEARTIFVDVGQVAVTQDSCVGMLRFQLLQQFQQGVFLLRCPRVSCSSVLVVATFVAHAERMAVEAYRMGTYQLLVARLVGRAVAGDVVVVACESEAIRVTADECCHGKATVTARGRAVNDNQINVAHDCTKNELMIAVSTVMMNWMMVFQRFTSLKNVIVVCC